MSTDLQINDLAVSDLTVIAIGPCGRADDELRAGGAAVTLVADVEAAQTEAWRLTAAADVFLLDLSDDCRLQDIDNLRQAAPDVGILALVPAERGEELGRRALADGALDYVIWPARTPDFLLATTLLVAHNGRLQREVRRLRRKGADAKVAEIIGCSPVVRRLQGVVARGAESDVPILIEGAPGTGKSLCAQRIHDLGRRALEELVVLDSEGLSVERLEEVLAAAQRSSLVLEDVEKLPTDTQARLVRYLKERSALGQGVVNGLGVRVIATTGARLAELTSRGNFREDLYYRLNIFPISMPALQERREDISLLADLFLQQSHLATGLPDQGFTPAAMILLESHPWAGNVSQLRNAILRAHTLAAGGKIDRVHLMSPAIGLSPARGMGLPPEEQIDNDEVDSELSEEDIRPFHEEEQRLLSRALRATKGNVRRAAQLLGIGRATLYRKIQVYKLRMH